MRTLTSILFLSLLFCVNAQDNSILWQQSYEGQDNVRFLNSATDSEGNVILVGLKQSVNDGVKNEDILVVKLDNGGNSIWQKSFGGSRDEQANNLFIDKNDQIILCGSTNSKDGIIKINKGLQDAFVMVLDKNGSLQQMNTYGGSSLDYGEHIIPLPNGHYLLGISSRSMDFPGVVSFGQFDVITLELNANLQVVNANSYGGWDDELIKKTLLLPDNSVLILSSSTTYTDAYSDNRGDQDIVLYNVNQEGEILWQRSYGGSLRDDPEDLILLSDGNILIAASSLSQDVDITDNHGGYDGWLFEINPGGSLLWSTTYGSSEKDEISSIKKAASGELIILGTTTRTEADNNTDFWLFNVNEPELDLLEQRYFGAGGFEQATSLILTPNGSIVMSGNRSTGTNDVNNSADGGWVLAIRDLKNPSLGITAHPNPTKDVIYFNNCPDELNIQIYSLSGTRVPVESDYFPGARIMDLSLLNAGVYLVQFESKGITETIRIVKQ